MSDKYEIYQQYRKTLLDTPVENHELYKDLIDEFTPIFEIDGCDEFERDLKELGEEIEIKYLYMKSFMDYVMSDLVQIRQEPVFYVRKEIGVGRRWIYV